MKTRLHVPVPEEPCTPRKLLQARKILQLQRGTTQGREWQAPRSVSQSLKTALAESWKTQQIRNLGSRWDHERKGHQFHLWWLIFKLYTRKHLTYISLVALIIYYLGHREYLEIPLSFPYGSFLSASPWISFFLSAPSSPSIPLTRNCCRSIPPLSLPLSAVSHFTWLFQLLHSPELNSVTAPWQFPFAGDSGN